MDERHPIRNSECSHAGSVVWYISFGDLLTLLVCFFFVLTPWHRLGSKNTSDLRHVSAYNEPLLTDGIDIAFNPTRQRETVLAEVPIYRCAVDGGLECESELSGTVDSDGAAGTAARLVTVRVCDREAVTEEVLELIGAFLERSRIHAVPATIELRGEGCEQFEILRPVTGQVVGAVRVM